MLRAVERTGAGCAAAVNTARREAVLVVFQQKQAAAHAGQLAACRVRPAAADAGGVAAGVVKRTAQHAGMVAIRFVFITASDAGTFAMRRAVKAAGDAGIQVVRRISIAASDAGKLAARRVALTAQHAGIRAAHRIGAAAQQPAIRRVVLLITHNQVVGTRANVHAAALAVRALRIVVADNHIAEAVDAGCAPATGVAVGCAQTIDNVQINPRQVQLRAFLAVRTCCVRDAGKARRDVFQAAHGCLLIGNGALQAGVLALQSVDATLQSFYGGLQCLDVGRGVGICDRQRESKQCARKRGSNSKTGEHRRFLLA